MDARIRAAILELLDLAKVDTRIVQFGVNGVTLEEIRAAIVSPVDNLLPDNQVAGPTLADLVTRINRLERYVANLHEVGMTSRPMK